MGIYGVAFSLGLTAAAALGAIGAGRRLAHAVLDRRPRCSSPPGSRRYGPTSGRATRPARGPIPWRQVLSLPTYVGIVLAVLQYGAIPFLDDVRSRAMGISAAAAATVLIVGRLISIVAKVIGGASADRIGAKASARRTALVLAATGLAWVLLPGNIATYAIAAVFAGTVSSLGPVANILAVERFGQNGMALGMYRSLQIALGAAASAVVGVAAGIVGLRPTLAVAALVPLALIWICRATNQRRFGLTRLSARADRARVGGRFPCFALRRHSHDLMGRLASPSWRVHDVVVCARAPRRPRLRTRLRRGDRRRPGSTPTAGRRRASRDAPHRRADAPRSARSTASG